MLERGKHDVLRDDLSVASEFSLAPGPRKRSEAEFSGQAFLEPFAASVFERAQQWDEASGRIRGRRGRGVGGDRRFFP